MRKIRAYVDWDDYSRTHYYTDFELVNELPKVGDTYYVNFDQQEIIRKIEEVELDCEQGNSDVYNYRFYKLICDFIDVDEEEVEEMEEYVCIEIKDED